METNVKQRIRQVFADEKKISERAFSELLGIGQKTFNKQMKEDTSMPMSTILLILGAIPNLSAEWLLRGVGEMYLSGDKSKPLSKPLSKPQELTGKPQEQTGKPQEPKTYTGDTSDKDELIDSLKARIAEQENYIADLRFMARLDKKQ